MITTKSVEEPPDRETITLSARETGRLLLKLARGDALSPTERDSLGCFAGYAKNVFPRDEREGEYRTGNPYCLPRWGGVVGKLYHNETVPQGDELPRGLHRLADELTDVRLSRERAKDLGEAIISEFTSS